MGYPRVDVESRGRSYRNPNWQGWAGHGQAHQAVGPERHETEPDIQHDIHGDGWDPEWYGFEGHRNPDRSVGGRHRYIDTNTYVEEDYPNELTRTSHRFKKW